MNVRTGLLGAAVVPLLAAGCAATPPRSASLEPAPSHVQAPAPQSPVQPSASDYRAQRASSLIGSSVLDGAGRMLGTIEDLIVNMRTGELRYALVAAKDAGATPLRAVHVKQLRSTSMSGFFTDVDQLSSVPMVHAGYPAGAYPASRLIGNAIEDLHGRPIGRIADLVIDMSAGEVQYAAISFAPHVGLGTERVFAVPVTGIGFVAGSSRRLVLNGRYEHLAQLAGFDPAHWPLPNDRRFLDTVRESFTVVFPPGTVGALR